MAEKTDKPNYYAIIPASVRYDKTLPGRAILLYGEITALCNQTGQCWANDDYFEGLYDVSRSTIQSWLSKLEKGHHIARKVIYKEGTKEIKKRYIIIVSEAATSTEKQDKGMPENKTTYSRNSGKPMPENQVSPMPENRTDNITSINTTVNNTNNKKHSAANVTPLAQLKKDFEEIWKEYPNKQDKGHAFNHYKAWRKKSVNHNNAYLFERLRLYKKHLAANPWKLLMNGSTWFNGRFTDNYQLTSSGNSSDNTAPTQKDYGGGTPW